MPLFALANHLVRSPAGRTSNGPAFALRSLSDIMKDGLCNRIFETLDELKLAVEKELQVFYDSAERVKQLLGQCVTVALANAS